MEIRPARPEELAQFPAIEHSAGEAFRGSSQDALADGDDTPAAFYAPLAAAGLVWVAADRSALVGFAACEAFDDALHLWELAVVHERQRQGLGRALLATVVEAARRSPTPAVTLTTFRDLRWNAPFYESCGFAIVPPERLNDRLLAVVAREVGMGLDITARCAMRLELPPLP
jgi:GNAT superfamily N-acetyltransferase